MNWRSLLILTVGTMSAIGLGIVPGGVQAQDDDSLALDFFVCDAELLAGNYGFNADGVIFSSDRKSRDTTFVALGLIQFRADGTLTVRVHESVGGVPEPDFENFEGTFEVGPDCIGTAEFADSSWDFVAVDNASEISLTTTEEGTAITADAVRIFQQ